jgi:predicted neuraminidase
LQILCRSKNARKVTTAFSEDQGATWSEITATSLPNNNAGLDAVTLQDGRHVLVYNHLIRGRNQLHVAISKDGRNWEAVTVLENEPGQEFSYPAVIQTSDGLVHITYTWKRRRVKHVVMDPARVESTPIVDGEWPVQK